MRLGAFPEDGRLVGVVSFKYEWRATSGTRGIVSHVARRGDFWLRHRVSVGPVTWAVELDRVEQVNLTVVATNEKAKLLYTSEGFEVFAIERCGLKRAREYRDEEQMALRRATGNAVSGLRTARFCYVYRVMM